jgi:hypothetical protein
MPPGCHGPAYASAFGWRKVIAKGSAKVIAAGSAKLIAEYWTAVRSRRMLRP